VMLDWSFGLKEEAKAVQEAIDHVLAVGPTTPDLLDGKGTTTSVGDAVVARILESSKVAK